MTEDLFRMAREAGGTAYTNRHYEGSAFAFGPEALKRFEQSIRAEEHEALEAELLKLKQGIAANSEYIQGRWDLIGEFQDVIRARKQK